jgi:hypothetical protein
MLKYSSVGIETGFGLDCRGLITDRAKFFFLFYTASRPALGTTLPPIQWVSGLLSLGVKRLGREVDRSSPSSVEVKNGGAIPPLPHIYSWHRA